MLKLVIINMLRRHNIQTEEKILQRIYILEIYDFFRE